MKQSKGFLVSLDKNKIKQILGSTSSRRPQHFVCITLLNFYQHFILTAVARGGGGSFIAGLYRGDC